jgi:hypothetical protein
MMEALMNPRPLCYLALLAAMMLATHGASAAAVPAPGFADALLGRWNVSVTAKDGTVYPSWFDIRLRTESALMAQFVGQFGSTRYASAVDFQDGRLVLRVPPQYEPAGSELSFDGVLGDGQLAGVTVGKDGDSLRWTAHRAPALPARPPLRWSAPVAWFNGRDLDRWRGQQTDRKSCWQVRAGAMVNKAGCTNLISQETLSDFKLHLEFKSIAGGNSGVYLRGRYEIQLSDHVGSLDPLRMGAVYGHLRPTQSAARPAGQWQALDVTLLGRTVTVVLNGITIIDAQEIPGITGGALDSDESAPGPLMLQGDHTPIEIRRLTVSTPLPQLRTRSKPD